MTSTPIERNEPENIPGSAFFNGDGEPTSIVVYASRELLEAFHAIAAKEHPDANHPSELMLREFMVRVAWRPVEEPPSIYNPISDTYEVIPSLIDRPRKRGPYKCSACGVIGHRADSRKCPRSVSQTETTAASASA